MPGHLFRNEIRRETQLMAVWQNGSSVGMTKGIIWGQSGEEISIKWLLIQSECIKEPLPVHLTHNSGMKSALSLEMGILYVNT